MEGMGTARTSVLSKGIERSGTGCIGIARLSDAAAKFCKVPSRSAEEWRHKAP